VVAVDAKDGKELWSFNLGTPQSGGIISYAVDGKQYIAVAAGGSYVRRSGSGRSRSGRMRPRELQRHHRRIRLTD